MYDMSYEKLTPVQPLQLGFCVPEHTTFLIFSVVSPVPPLARACLSWFALPCALPLSTKYSLIKRTIDGVQQPVVQVEHDPLESVTE